MTEQPLPLSPKCVLERHASARGKSETEGEMYEH